jgi:hypothetical protein
VSLCADTVGFDDFGAVTSLRKWFAFETTIDRVRYCYHQGDWNRIGEGFVEQIRAQVAELLNQRSDLTFPLWVPAGERDDEHRYCELVAEEPGYLCLDKSLAAFRPRTDPSAVILAIAGRAWDVDRLFTLSQIGLLRLDRVMRHLRTRLAFAEIPFTLKADAKRVLALVRSAGVVELFEFLQSVEQVALVPDQGAVEQLVSAGLHPALHERIHARDPDAAEHGLGSGVLEDRVEQGGELSIAVPDQEPRTAAGILEVHDEILGGLRHPGRGRMGGGAQDPDPSAGVLKHRQHVHPRPVKVVVSKKSHASRASAWERRKSAHVVEERSGAGSISASFRISHTVEAVVLISRTSSSP